VLEKEQARQLIRVSMVGDGDKCLKCKEDKDSQKGLTERMQNFTILIKS
jgi:hypothetical protein